MLVKLTQDLSRGLAPWKEMFFENEAELNALGAKLIFAGTEKDDPNQLHAIMLFPSMEALQAFGANAELTEIRRKAGAVIESGIMTPISDDYFTNYPDAVIEH